MNQNALYELSDDMFEKLSDSEKNNEFIAVQSKTYFQMPGLTQEKQTRPRQPVLSFGHGGACHPGSPASPYTYDGQDLMLRNDPPSLSHPLGTDKFGRDIFVRLMYGARISLSVALPQPLSISSSAWYTRRVRIFRRQAGHGAHAHCRCHLLHSQHAVCHHGHAHLRLQHLFGAAGPLGERLIGMARQVRTQVMSLKEREYAQAARVMGASHRRILFKHLITNSIGPIIVNTTLMVLRPSSPKPFWPCGHRHQYPPVELGHHGQRGPLPDPKLSHPNAVARSCHQLDHAKFEFHRRRAQ